MPVVNTHVCAQERVCLDRPLPVFRLFQSLKEWFQSNTKSVALEFLLSEINESCGKDSDKLIMLCLLCFHRLKKNITIIELINSVGFFVLLNLHLATLYRCFGPLGVFYGNLLFSACK